MRKSEWPDHITGVVNGDIPDSKINLRRDFSQHSFTVYEGGLSQQALEIARLIEANKVPQPSILLHPIINAFERAKEEGKDYLLVFASTWGDEYPLIRAIDSQDGDPYAFYQDLSGKLEYKALVMALNLEESFREQFPDIFYESIETWEGLIAKPVISTGIFPVNIVWGEHRPLSLPCYKPSPVSI